ncbi:MAG: hypothetical protein FJX65_10870 [Alphaproteobacteria bacterium]|nr:hypothetical protein [Alphaproteobacteria bacterium]
MSRKPPFFDVPHVDALMRMNTELLAELWIVKDRLLVLEHLVGQKLGLDSEAIDRFTPDPALAERLDREREQVMKKVMLAPFADEDRRVETILETYLGKKRPSAKT